MRPVSFDVECYINFFEVGFLDFISGKYKVFQMFGEGEYINTNELRSFITKKSYTFIGFNSNNYDAVMVEAAICGYSCSKLKEISDALIVEELKPWIVRKKYNIQRIYFDHIDLIEVAIGQCSLKMYAARLHHDELEDLPFPADKELTREEADKVVLYNKKDLRVTKVLADKLEGALQVRKEISNDYNIDVRSKSDAQIAEAIFKHELEKLGIYCERPKIKPGTTYKYKIPPQFEFAFESDELIQLLEDVRNAEFVVSEAGKIGLPKILDRQICIAGKFYKMGVGGLHSQESAQVVLTENTGYLLFEKDVASYYPNIILNQKLFPKHLGEEFLHVYSDVVTKRLYAKPRGKGKIPGLTQDEIKHFKKIDETLKIVINGSFGKFGNKWSIIYAPDFLMQVTITGQLGLLWLIEMIEKIDEAEVKSANTDGIVVYCSEEAYDKVEQVCKYWEKENNLELDENRYEAIYSRDVNNYLAIKKGDEPKTKGIFSEAGLSKGAAGYISVKAVIDYLKDKTSIEDTIYLCDDIREFVHVRQVKGGGCWSIPKELPNLNVAGKREFLIKNGWKPVVLLDSSNKRNFRAHTESDKTPKYWCHKIHTYYQDALTTDKAFNMYKSFTEYQPEVIKYLGKTVRWYYAEGCENHSITYASNGNTVATSLGSKPIMDLPSKLPSDINYNKYIDDAIDILKSVGIDYVRN